MQVIVNDVQHRLSILQLDGAIETGTSSSMARCVVTGDLNFQPDSILVTIGTHLLHGLQISGGFTLFPYFPARTAEVVRRFCLYGQCQGLGIHMRDHQQFTIISVGNDRGDRAAIIETRSEISASSSSDLSEEGSLNTRFISGSFFEAQSAAPDHRHEADLLGRIGLEGAGESRR